jgi:predicted alpha/beta superfamily hydrolase
MRSVAALVGPLLVGAACAPAAPPDSLGSSAQLALHSVHRGQEYQLRIALPRSYADSTHSFPVLYVLDGNALFGIATDVVRLLSLRSSFPEIIVVGIAYPTTSSTEVLRLRLADFTPTNVPSEDTLGGVADLAPSARSGNSVAFSRTLLEEIIPLVEGRFRVDSTRRGLWGYSLGGLFALNVLLEHPQTFTGYVATSPSLWWDSDQIFDHPAISAPLSALPRTRVFLSAGGLEEATNPWTKMTTNLERFRQASLDRGDRSSTVTVIFPDETHLSVPAVSFARGIQVLFTPGPH